MDDWKAEIVKGVIAHQRLQELDVRGLWSYHLPEVAAGEDEIAATERRLGFALDSKYRAFLRHANGWRSFYQDVGIFGTRALLGEGTMTAARDQLNALEPDVFMNDVGIEIGDLLPIAASELQPDMFLLGLSGSSAPGAVIWFAGYLVERFTDFDEFYLAMLDYNRRQIRIFETTT